MCTTRNGWVAAIISWMTCLTVASLVFAADESAQFRGPDISGLWQVEGELLHESGHRVLFAYGELRDEDYDEAMAIHFGDGEPPASVVQCGRKVEGTGARDVPCGECPQVTYAGTVSEDNQVELTATIPGIKEFCNQDDKSDHFRDQSCKLSQTDWVASFKGTYDPTSKVITGTFTAYQDRDYRQCWKLDGSYWFEDETNIITTGTFKIKVVKPWILIHGWTSRDEIWTPAFTDFLEKDDIPFATVDLGDDANPDKRAITLAREIDRIRGERGWPDVKVNLVAHSQGGLDARAYIHNLRENAKDQVYSLTMIGTPNHGTVLADILTLASYTASFLSPVYVPSEHWLSPPWVEDLNQRTPLNADVKYYTVAGATRVLGLSWLIPSDNDGRVPVKSVHLDRATPLGPSPGKSTFPYEHNELVTKEDVYDAIKKVVDPPYSSEPDALAFIAIDDGAILPGQPVSRSVTVDDVNEMAFVLISPDPLGFTLRSPDGDQITPQSLSAATSYDSSDCLDLHIQTYVVQKPGSGAWNAEVAGGAEPNSFVLVVSAENTFALDGSTDEYFYPVGGEVRLRASIDAATTVADMRADILYPDGSRGTVVLYDDGLHEDDLPSDGVYGNAFSPSLDGLHVIVFSARGIVGGKEFSRADLESIMVEAPAGGFEGGFEGLPSN